MDHYTLKIGIAFLLSLGTCWGGPLPSVAVGTCKPNLQSYSTIQDAVGNVASGGTILVCPGAYPEQVLINKPLTMKGVLSGDAAASIITSPQGGLKQSTIDHLGNAWAAQLLVQSTAGPVDISDLSLDGANNGISGGCPGLNVVGIYYQEASGVIDRAATRNQTTPCLHDAGIFLESFGPGNQAVTVENSSVRGFDGSGIYADTDFTTPNPHADDCQQSGYRRSGYGDRHGSRQSQGHCEIQYRGAHVCRNRGFSRNHDRDIEHGRWRRWIGRCTAYY